MCEEEIGHNGEAFLKQERKKQEVIKKKHGDRGISFYRPRIKSLKIGICKRIIKTKKCTKEVSRDKQCLKRNQRERRRLLDQQSIYHMNMNT